MFRTGRKKYVLFVILLVILLLLLYFFSDPVDNTVKEEVKVVATGKTTDSDFSVVYDGDNGETILLKSGVKVEVLSKFRQDIQEVLILPDVSTFKDITKSKPVSENTWESDLVTSVEYVNMLEKDGFEVIQEVATSQYVELILIKENVRKRVIILRSLLIVADMEEDAELPSITSVIKKYKH